MTRKRLNEHAFTFRTRDRVEDNMTSDTGPDLIGGIDPELAGRLASRRDLFARASLVLGGLASAPMLLASVATQAFGQGAALPKVIVDALNFALTLEYLEAEFYVTGNANPFLIPVEFAAVFDQLAKHETQHVAFLRTALGGAAVAKPKFDFTGGGKFADVFSNFTTFATLSQTFEDLGVRAYKGQVGNLTSNPAILTAALRIHSVEARHAAQVRRVRGVRAWDGPYDEPLDKASVLAAATPFLAR